MMKKYQTPATKQIVAKAFTSVMVSSMDIHTETVNGNEALGKETFGDIWSEEDVEE